MVSLGRIARSGNGRHTEGVLETLVKEKWGCGCRMFKAKVGECVRVDRMPRLEFRSAGSKH